MQLGSDMVRREPRKSGAREVLLLGVVFEREARSRSEGPPLRLKEDADGDA